MSLSSQDKADIGLIHKFYRWDTTKGLPISHVSNSKAIFTSFNNISQAYTLIIQYYLSISY